MNLTKLCSSSFVAILFILMVPAPPDLHGAETEPSEMVGAVSVPALTPLAKKQLDETAAAVQLLKRKVDALEIESAKENQPWYKDVATIIAVLSFVFAFGTTWVSSRKANAQEIEAHRSELRSLLQRMATLPKENLEAMEKYRANPGALSTVSGYINQENTFLAAQAAEITKRLPAEKISAVEYYAVALGLGNAYDLEGQKKFLALAIQTATDFNTEIAAVRTNAYVLFLTGDPTTGRTEYQKALQIFDKYPGYDEYTRMSTHIKTELNWAYSEYQAQAGSPLAEQHLNQASALVGTLVPSPGRAQFEADVGQARQQLRFPGSAFRT